MSSYGNGRDPYSRDGPSRSHDPRARSRSPPARHYQERDKVVTRIHRNDHDAPPKSLPRKPGTSANALPVGTAAGHGSLNHGYASGSTHPLERNATSHHSNASTYPEPSATRRSSAVVEALADLVGRLYASPPERHLFDQIELKRHAISEDRKNLSDQYKKLKSVQDWLARVGRGDPSNVAKLTEQEKIVRNLELKINTDVDELYRMQLQWQVDVNAQIMPSLLAAVSAPLEAKLQDLAAEVKSEREKDHKHRAEFENTAHSHFGQSNRFQSDIRAIKADLSALTKDNDHLRKDLTETRTSLRNDVDKDVRQINENRKCIKELQKELAEFRRDSRIAGSRHSVASGSARETSTAPSSPRPATQARPSTSNITTLPPAATTTEGSAHNGREGSTTAEQSKAVTQAQFRKWHKEYMQDLELRLDEVKDLAVQEATAENQACMDDRLRALARKWKSRALAGDDLSARPAPAAPIANGGESSSNAAPPTDGAGPMNVEEIIDVSGPTQPNGQSNDANVTNGAETAPKGGAEISNSGSTGPMPTQPASDLQKAASGFNAALQATPTAAQTNANSVPAPTKTDSTPAGQPTPSTSPQPIGNAAEQPPVAQKNGTGEKDAFVPVAALELIRASLKEHETQLTAVKQEVDTLRLSGNAASVDQWLSSPDKLKQLLRALKLNGLDSLNDALRNAVAQVQNVTTQIRSEMVALRSSQQEQKSDFESTLQTHKEEILSELYDKLDSLQKQLEALDDQSSLQGALLVKLAEHANPRRNPPTTATTSGGARGSVGSQSPAVRSPLVQHAPNSAGALAPTPRPEHQLQRPVQQHPPVLPNTAATALSAHMQPPMYPQQQPALHPAQVQAYQQIAPQAQQHPQSSYAVPRGPYPYQDPNQRQGYH
ncbi:hypothetical protein PSEUBRA_001613 [Kalmanozyma brasiliensis GHG001]|uniref:uncharacterized protein n=1 Tax=Kalmanozyma brasiliensis (strain GHG001) TaxID=1365824 RepID=UPI002867EFE2|nr:uncharacterized protein PSEUBRA_001613 [Kalmanozyma brasiliensis GHG001]KAF6766977.1 hypothetical protein PSEUBRA_001613 [Kalmanozyma brasiliensis GHG001]